MLKKLVALSLIHTAVMYPFIDTIGYALQTVAYWCKPSMGSPFGKDGNYSSHSIRLLDGTRVDWNKEFEKDWNTREHYCKCFKYSSVVKNKTNISTGIVEESISTAVHWDRRNNEQYDAHDEDVYKRWGLRLLYDKQERQKNILKATVFLGAMSYVVYKANHHPVDLDSVINYSTALAAMVFPVRYMLYGRPMEKFQGVLGLGLVLSIRRVVYHYI